MAEYAGHLERISPVRRQAGLYGAARAGGHARRHYGIYGPAFELLEDRPREPGSEEYFDSEKYEIKHWNRDKPDSLKEFIARVNRIRAENAALQSDHSLRFHDVDNEQIICYTKQSEDLTQYDRRSRESRSAPRAVRLGEASRSRRLQLDAAESYQAHDLLTGARFLWHGERNYVELDPADAPAHIFRHTPARAARTGFRLLHVTTMKLEKKSTREFAPTDDPLWYKDAVIYELHVRAFSDGNADGIGDFKGLTEKLDYLHDLGVTALWLLPFYPSPLKDDGYDLASYTEIHPDYGTLKDFKIFLREAHRRGLRVITELVRQSHLGSASLVSARAARGAGQQGARFLRLERQPGTVQGSAHYFQRL